MIKQVVTTLKMFPVFEAVTIPFIGERISSDRRFAADEALSTAAQSMMGELVRVERALRPLCVA